jgi:hypothetical protein
MGSPRNRIISWARAMNGDVTDNRVSLIGGAAWSGAYDAGGQALETTAAGQGVDFTINTPANYNQVTVSYIDSGSGSLTVSVDGTVTGTIQICNTGNTLTQTITMPAGIYSQVSVIANNANPTLIQGVSFRNSASNAVTVYDAGIGGWGAGSANTSVFNGGYWRVPGSGLGRSRARLR